MRNIYDLASIKDPFPRFVQSVRFLDLLEKTEEQAIKIRDQTLLELRKDMTQQALANAIGVTRQRVHQLEKEARKRQRKEK